MTSPPLPGSTTPPPEAAYVAPMIYGAVVMAAFTIAAVITIAILRPDNASVISTVIGVSSPIILGLMAVGLQGIHKLTNSNLSSVKSDLQQALTRIEEMHETASLNTVTHAHFESDVVRPPADPELVRQIIREYEASKTTPHIVEGSPVRVEVVNTPETAVPVTTKKV